MEQSKQDAQRQTLVCAVPYLLPWLCGSKMCAPTGFLPLPSCCFCTPHGPVLCSTSHLLPIASLGRCPMSLVTIFQYHSDFPCPLSDFQLEQQTFHISIPWHSFEWWVDGSPSLLTLVHCPCKSSQVDNIKFFHYNTALCSSVEMLLSRKNSLVNESTIRYLRSMCWGRPGQFPRYPRVSFYCLNTKLGFFLMILISLTTTLNLFATFNCSFLARLHSVFGSFYSAFYD